MDEEIWMIEKMITWDAALLLKWKKKMKKSGYFLEG